MSIPKFSNVRVTFDLLHKDRVVTTHEFVLNTKGTDVSTVDGVETIAAACAYHSIALWSEIIRRWESEKP